MILISMVVATVLTSGPTDGARPQPPTVVVLDHSLHATTGELVSLTATDAVVKAAGKDVTVSRPVAVVTAARWGPDRDWPGIPPEPTGELGPSVSVELTDGSTLRGDLLSGKGDGLVLVHKRLNRVEFNLDGLRSLTLRGNQPPSPDNARTGDVVRLANGDRLEGFVESIGAGAGGSGLAVSIERASDKSKTAVSLERVAWVLLNGNAVAKGKPAATVWLAEDERTTAAEFSVDKREARIVRTKGALAARLDAGMIEGALLDGDAVTPLAACPFKGKVELGPQQPLGCRDVQLPEPGRASWTLPAGTARITGWAVLPEECRRWGDCDAVLSVEGVDKPLKSFTLNGTNPVAPLELELPAAGAAATLVLTVTEGKHGPVQDRVVLRHVLVAK